MEKPKLTDLQTERLLLDATLVAAFAPLAAMFFAQPGLSPVVLPPPPPGFVLEGCCDTMMGPLMFGAMLVAAIEEKTAGLVPGSETDLTKELSEPVLDARLTSTRTLLGLGMLLFFSKQSSALWVLGLKFLERWILWGILC